MNCRDDQCNSIPTGSLHSRRGIITAMRYENWKFVFCEQRVEGTLRVWAEPFVCLRKTYRSACKRNGGKAA
jgi:hypothetical protein